MRLWKEDKMNEYEKITRAIIKDLEYSIYPQFWDMEEKLQKEIIERWTKIIKDGYKNILVSYLKG